MIDATARAETKFADEHALEFPFGAPEVHPEVFFSPETFQNQKCEGHHGQGHVMMPAGPGSPFKMIQPQIIFKLLIVLLNPPPDFGPIDQLVQGRGFRQIGEPIFYGSDSDRGHSMSSQTTGSVALPLK